MLSSLVTIIGWAAVIFMVAVTALLATNRQTGLKLIQHRPEMLPQALLVRYVGLALLALLAALLNAPAILFAMLLSFAVIGMGDAFVYRRAGHPFWLHLAGGGAAFVGAIIAFFAIP